MIVLRGSTVPGFPNDAQVVSRTWDFEAINNGYQDYLTFIGKRPQAKRPPKLDWIFQEARM